MGGSLGYCTSVPEIIVRWQLRALWTDQPPPFYHPTPLSARGYGRECEYVAKDRSVTGLIKNTHLLPAMSHYTSNGLIAQHDAVKPLRRRRRATEMLIATCHSKYVPGIVEVYPPSSVGASEMSSIGYTRKTPKFLRSAESALSRRPMFQKCVLTNWRWKGV